MNFIAWTIVACEIGFWVVIALGLITRYIFKRERARFLLSRPNTCYRPYTAHRHSNRPIQRSNRDTSARHRRHLSRLLHRVRQKYDSLG